MNKQDTQHNEEQDNEKVLADGPSKKNLKKIISEAKQKGYITQDQLEELVISEKLSSEQIEDLMTDLSGMGINVTENEESEYSEEVEEQTSSKEIVATNTDSETLDKTDDPVRMYLREMGSVELLSREGEIAIAKRIEAGRNLMINGLCESPLTFQAITIWRNELLNEEIMLRDVIDLETTFTEIGDSNELDAEIKKLDINESTENLKLTRNEQENQSALAQDETKNNEDEEEEDAINVSNSCPSKTVVRRRVLLEDGAIARGAGQRIRSTHPWRRRCWSRTAEMPPSSPTLAQHIIIWCHNHQVWQERQALHGMHQRLSE